MTSALVALTLDASWRLHDCTARALDLTAAALPVGAEMAMLNAIWDSAEERTAKTE